MLFLRPQNALQLAQKPGTLAMDQNSGSRTAREAAIAAMERVRLLLEALEEPGILRDTIAAAHNTIHEATTRFQAYTGTESEQEHQKKPHCILSDVDIFPSPHATERPRQRLN